MKKTLFISLCLFSALYGCGPKDNTVSYNEETGLTVCHYSNVKDTVYLKLSDLVEDFRIVRFDNSPEAIFTYRTLPTITDHYIGVGTSASQPFMLFNSDGKYLCTAGKIGQGPGEYPRTIYDSAIDEQEQKIYLGCFASFDKILIYDLKGNFLEDRKIDYELNKPKFELGEDKSLSIVHLPVQTTGESPLVSQYSKEGKLIAQLEEAPFFKVNNFNQDIFAYHNVPDLSFHITSVDTLYHYIKSENRIVPKFTLNFGAMEDKPIHIYNEIPGYYIAMVFGQGNIFVDKEKQQARYVRLVNDFCGGMKVMLNFKDGWVWRIFEPGYLIEYIQDRMNDSDCTEEDREKLQSLLDTIDEDDNNIMFLGKLKK